MNPGTLIVIAFGLAFTAAAVSVGLNVHVKKYRDDPKVILQRCRMELWAVKRELSNLPASHDVLKQIDDAVHTADLVEARFAQMASNKEEVCVAIADGKVRITPERPRDQDWWKRI